MSDVFISAETVIPQHKLDDGRVTAGRALFVGAPPEMCVMCGAIDFDGDAMVFYQRDGHPGFYLLLAGDILIEECIAVAHSHGFHELSASTDPASTDIVMPENTGA
jgi:hypothetical protein